MKKAIIVFLAIALLLSVVSVTEAIIWKKPGISPFKKYPEMYSTQQLNRDRKALKLLGLKEVKIDSIISNHLTKKDFRWDVIKAGDNFEKMIFGNYKVWQDDDNGIVVGFQKKLAAKVYSIDNNYEIWFPLICGNWAIKRISPKKIVKSLPKPSFPVVPKFKQPVLRVKMPSLPVVSIKPGLPPVPRFKEPARDLSAKEICGFDLYMGGGFYETDRWLNSNNKDYDHQGWYFWGKARYRPFGFDVTDRIYACFGVFAFGGIGSGDDEGYFYDWQKLVIGPSLKLTGYKDHWDADFDLGLWGQLTSEGEKGLYESEQVDNISVFSAHLNMYKRRVEKEKWFPKTELNLEFTLPHNRYHERSWDGNRLDPDPHNNQVLEIALTQHLYDFEISENLLLTPGVNLSYINENGLENPDFIQFGPRVTLTWYDQDILSISALNYKENLGGDGDQWHWLSGYLSISGLIKAYNASQITEPDKKDLCFVCP